MSALEMDSDLINGLLANPERNFTRLLFELSPIANIETLAELVLHPNGGHAITIRCLCVWQDLQGHQSAFSSILEEMQNAECDRSFGRCLELVNRLLDYAPDNVVKIRILCQLNEIRFETHLREICFRFSSPQLADEIEKFRLLSRRSPVAEITHTPVVDVHRGATDADSGTFSSEEDDAMPNATERSELNENKNSTTHSVNSDVTHEINRLISQIESPDVLVLLAELLRELGNAKEPASAVLRLLNAELGRLNQKSTVENGKPIPNPPPLAPPPPKLIPSKVGIPPPPGIVRPPPPPLAGAATSTRAKAEVPIALKPKILPPDGKKLRQLQWTKIPLNSLTLANATDSSSVWLQMDSLGSEFVRKLDFSALDNHFACETPVDAQTVAATEKENKQQTVSLLNGKRSLSVNVFLKSFKGVDELINYIRRGTTTEVGGLDRLRMLVPLLPTEEECQTLRNYTGDRAELGTAEQFLLLLLGVPDYSLRIESTILRDEFSVLVKTIEPDLRTLITACKELRQSRNLRTVLLILLHMGNYLNHGGGLGNAVAFKLSSLWKIDELRAINGGRTLLHLVAQQAHQTASNLDDITHVDVAAKVPFESLKSDLKTSTERVGRLTNQLKQKADDPFFSEIRAFLSEATQQMNESNKLLSELDEERRRLATYFCENEKTFSLEECFKIFSNFRSRFALASMENHEREERKERNHGRKAVGGASGPLPAPIQTPTSPRSPAASVSSLSPTTIRRTSSIIVEQDRDRNSTPQLGSLRRKSSIRRESSIFDKNDSTKSTGDLGAFVDQALEFNRRRSSRMSANSPLPSVLEFGDNENRDTEEVRVPVPTMDSRLVDTPLSVRVLSETTKQAGRRPLTAEENKQPPQVRKISEPVVSSSPTTPSNARPSTAIGHNRTTSNPVVTTQPPSSRVDRAEALARGPGLTKRLPTPTSAKRESVESKPEVDKQEMSPKVLRKVPAPLQNSSVDLTPPEPLASPLRKNVLGRVRARQVYEPSLTSGSTSQFPTPPLRPSQIRAAQTRSGSNVGSPVNSQPTVTLNNATSENRTSTLPKRTTTTSSAPSTPRKTAKLAISTPGSARTPVTAGHAETTSARPTRTPMSASEKRSLFRQNTSVSTASRPSIIKTGSTTERPRWF